ncbi:DUF2232 domain-containing protein [Candidatus Riflebacteria bacterium]
MSSQVTRGRPSGFLLLSLALISYFLIFTYVVLNGSIIFFLLSPLPLLALLYGGFSSEFKASLIIFLSLGLLGFLLPGNRGPVLSFEIYFLIFPFLLGHALTNQQVEKSSSATILCATLLPFFCCLIAYNIYYLLLFPQKNLKAMAERKKINEEIILKTISSFRDYAKKQCTEEQYEELQPRIEQLEKKISGFVASIEIFIPGTQFFISCFFYSFFSYLLIPASVTLFLNKKAMLDSFSNFSLHWSLIWLFILSTLGSYFESPIMAKDIVFLSMNFFAISSFLFFFQGVAIIDWWLAVFKWHAFIRIIFYWLILIFSFYTGLAGVFLLFLVILGISEIWIPLRPVQSIEMIDTGESGSHDASQKEPENQPDGQNGQIDSRSEPTGTEKDEFPDNNSDASIDEKREIISGKNGEKENSAEKITGKEE